MASAPRAAEYSRRFESISSLIRVLFEVPFARMAWPQANYDVARDGKRFLVILGSDPPTPTSVHLVTNWVHDLSPSGGR